MKIKLSKIITGILLAGTLLSTQEIGANQMDGPMEVCLIAHGEDKTLIFIMELWNWQ